MSIGFQTEQGSLYWIDPRGYTHRLERAGGYGLGEVQRPHACVFAPEAIRKDALGVNPAQYRVYLSVLLHGIIREAHTPAELQDAIRRGDRVGLTVQERLSGVTVGGGPCDIAPAIGLYPFEQARLPDEGGVLRRRYHLGERITALFRTPEGLIAKGFPIGTILRHQGLQGRGGPRGATP